MRTRQYLTAALLGLVLGGRAAALAADEAPSVDKLAQRLAGGGSPAERRDAAYQLNALGAKAQPALPALIKALEDPDKQVWSLSISALATLGPAARDAVPALLSGLDSRTTRGNRERDRRQTLFRSAYALSQIGPEVVPQLIEALKGQDSWLRAGAAKALGGIGPAAHAAALGLVANLSHDDADERRETIEALGLIGREAVAPLIEALDRKEPSVRAGAALALAQSGREAGAAADRVAALTASERDPAVRAALLTALPRIGVEPGRAVELLVQAIKDDQEPVRHAAVNAIYLLHSANDRLIPALSAMLRDPNPVLGERAAIVLGRLGPAAAPAVPAILAAARQREPMPPLYFRAIAEIGPRAVPEVLHAIEQESPDQLGRDHWSVACLMAIGGEAVAPLAPALSSPQVSVRLVAARALGELGPVAAPAVKELSAATADADPRVRATALGGLVSCRAQAVAAASRVETGLQDSSPIVRAAAAELIPHLGDQARSLAPALLAALGDADATVRASVVHSLASVGADAEPAIPRLVEVLPTSDPETRARILLVFAGIGPKGKAVLPALNERLHEPEPAVRAAAVTAFAKIAAPAESLPILRSALQDAALPVRRAAAAGLGDLGDKAGDSSERLAELLQNPEERDFAFDALRKTPVRSTPVLVKLLSDHDLTVRMFACQRLGKLGPAASEAVPALEAILQAGKERGDLKRSAEAALKKIKPQGGT